MSKNNIFQSHRSLIVALIFSPFIGFVLGCSSNQSEQTDKDLLPDAAGEITEVLIVIDSAQWAGPVGDFFKETLGAPIPGLPQDEAQYTIRRIDPFKMNSVLKTAKSIVYVTILNDQSRGGIYMTNNITPESKERIQNEPDLFMFTKKDEYAIGQEITHLFGTDQEALLVNLYKNKERLINHFNVKARERISTKLYVVGEQKNLSSKLITDHQFSIRIPNGYAIADEKENFVWIRKLDPEVDLSVIVYYTDYVSQDVFQQENLLAFREEITSTYLRDIQKPDLYITYQPIYPMASQAINFNGEFAMKSMGLWRLSDNTMGGPYRSYAFVDQSLNRLYYLEGYIMAPGKKKREPLLEIEVILSTFRTKDQLENQNNS